MQAAAAMSAAEGLDEAAKDAADIAAFFKSGKSMEGASVDVCEGGGWESSLGCVIARPGGRRLIQWEACVLLSSTGSGDAPLFRIWMYSGLVGPQPLVTASPLMAAV